MENEKLVERLREGADWPEVRPISASELRETAAALTAAEARIKMLSEVLAKTEAAISWALGEGDSDFGDNKPENAKPFWWRTELRERARALSARSAEPVAWMHVMTYETGETNEQLSFDEENPFGEPGKDYSAEYPVGAIPLYAHPNPEASDV